MLVARQQSMTVAKHHADTFLLHTSDARERLPPFNVPKLS